MTYAVIALLDEGSTKRFTALRNAIGISNSNDSNSLPHLTLAIYDKEFEIDGLIEWTRNIAQNHSRSKVFYPAVGVMYEYCLIAGSV